MRAKDYNSAANLRNEPTVQAESTLELQQSAETQVVRAHRAVITLRRVPGAELDRCSSCDDPMEEPNTMEVLHFNFDGGGAALVLADGSLSVVDGEWLHYMLIENDEGGRSYYAEGIEDPSKLKPFRQSPPEPATRPKAKRRKAG